MFQHVTFQAALVWSEHASVVLLNYEDASAPWPVTGPRDVILRGLSDGVTIPRRLEPLTAADLTRLESMGNTSEILAKIPSVSQTL